MKITKSKRLKIVLGALIANFIIVIIAMIIGGVDLTALGTCLSLINTPLYIYVLGETFRKSETKTSTKESDYTTQP